MLDHSPGEFFGVLAETLHRFIWMNGFRGIDADEPHFFVRADDYCVAVDNANDQALFGNCVARFSGLLGNANRRFLMGSRTGFERRRCE